MTKNKRPSYYGKLQTKSLDREVYQIWKTRDDELDELPVIPDNTKVSYELDIEQQDYVQKLLATVRCTTNEWKVLHKTIIYGFTLEETGNELGVTRERVRQIQYRALRKLRRAAFEIKNSEDLCKLDYKFNRETESWKLKYCKAELARPN